jgi:hypothetical protein
MAHEQGPDRELGRQALRQRVQRLQRARRLVEPSTRDEFAERPDDPAGQAVVVVARRGHAIDVDRRRQRGFDRTAGGVEVRRQRGFERVGDLHRACLHLERIEPLQRRALEALAIEVARVARQRRAGGAHQRWIEQVLERLHGASPLHRQPPEAAKAHARIALGRAVEL